MTKVLMIGPFPNPISGVSLANEVVKKTLISNNFKVSIVNTSLPFFEENIGKFSLKKFLYFLSLNFHVFKVFSHNTIYITPGQTFFGITKYSLFILLSSLLNKELIIHVHGNYLHQEYNNLKGIKNRIFYFLLSKFNKGIVLSNSLKKNLLPFMNSDMIFVVNNFAENYLYEETLKKDGKILKISFLSNLMEEKGIFFLIDALMMLEKNNIKYEAKIAGNIDVNIQELILSKISKLKNTEYLGVLYGKEKKELLDWSNIFVLPTFYKMEGQPISILEALATQNIIITTKHAGIPDVITNGSNGFFVEKRSAESLYNKFIYIDDNKEKINSISVNNKNYFKENFTLQMFSKNIVKVLNDGSRTK